MQLEKVILKKFNLTELDKEMCECIASNDSKLLFNLLGLSNDISEFKKFLNNSSSFSNNRDKIWPKCGSNKRTYEKDYFGTKYQITPPNIEKGVYKCKKCGGEETQNVSMQLRSGDEPMTTFVMCLNQKCKARWTD